MSMRSVGVLRGMHQPRTMIVMMVLTWISGVLMFGVSLQIAIPRLKFIV